MQQSWIRKPAASSDSSAVLSWRRGCRFLLGERCSEFSRFVAETMIKNRQNSIRTKDEDGYTRRAGCICFKSEQEKEVLLVSSCRHPGRWIVPSGGVEPGEESREAAIREVEEEAGVRGRLGRFLGEFQNDVNQTRTSVYVLIVTEMLEKWEEDRIRSWFPVEIAKDMLKAKPYQQQYLAKACSSR
ncbi:hypothetical protein ACROYT_G027378 [Oculina patagonica]